MERAAFVHGGVLFFYKHHAMGLAMMEHWFLDLSFDCFFFFAVWDGLDRFRCRLPSWY